MEVIFIFNSFLENLRILNNIRVNKRRVILCIKNKKIKYGISSWLKQSKKQR